MRALHRLVIIVCLGLTASVGAVAAEPLKLSAEQQRFIHDHPTIRARTQSHWPPFLFVENGTAQGISIDYLRLAAQRLGLNIEEAPNMSFAEVIERLPGGDGIDVQPTMRATDERRAHMAFSRPYATFPVVIVTRSDSPFVGSLDDLAGKMVAVEQAYWYTDELRRDHPSLVLRLVPTSDDALRLLAQGDADAYVGVLPVATWHMEHKGYTNLKIAAPTPLSPAELSFAVRGDWPLLAQAFDLALDSIGNDEQRAIRQRWLNIPAEYGVDPRVVGLWGGGGLALALTLIGGFALANRRLIREIGLRRQAEAQLRTAEETSRQLLDASSDACMLFDTDGTMRACNQVFASRFGVDASLVVGASLWDFFPPDVAAQRREAVAAVIASGRPSVTNDIRNGRHLSNSIYPLRDGAGVVRRVAVYSRDVSEQVWAEQKIKSYVAEIERSNEDLEQFAYVASHDLREPLRQVSSYVALLERRYGSRLDDDAHQFIAYAREGVDRMDQLILDLLDYSRIGRGEPPKPIDSTPALRVAVDNLRMALAESGGTVDMPGPFPRVQACEPQLVRLFQNLIGNGLKYHRDGVAPRIQVSAITDDDFATFTIADNGIGIEPEYHERIFGIFQRLHGRTQYPGTGIGLAVCRKVVERHGGHIWVESIPGQGTSFHFSLKRAS